jgi:hypothetical protein
MPKAVTEWRKARAVELAVMGTPYEEIAQEVGYANRGTAWRTVTNALAERTDKGVKELRVLEGDRLDQLQNALWGEAVAGDVKAVDAVLRIIQARVRLFGLDSPEVRAAEGLRVVIDPAELARRGEAAVRRDEEATEAWYLEKFGTGEVVAVD